MTEKPQLSYEQARDQLIEVVHQLEAGNVPLSKSMELWERGEQLAAICAEWLDAAKAKIAASRTAEPGQGSPS
ncbi:MAG: exodeoxyribonuclease VII small subunit [Micropruina sp.]